MLFQIVFRCVFQLGFVFMIRPRINRLNPRELIHLTYITVIETKIRYVYLFRGYVKYHNLDF